MSCFYFFFFFNDTATTEIYTLSLHDALPIYWGYPEQWMERWRGSLTITPEFVGRNEVYAATLNGEILGFYALVGEGRELQLEHLWVSPERIGTGVGRLLFDHAVRRAASLGAEILR